MPVADTSPRWQRVGRFLGVNVGLWGGCAILAHGVTALLAGLGAYGPDPPGMGLEGFYNSALATAIVSLPFVGLYLLGVGALGSRVGPPWFRLVALAAAPLLIGVPLAPSMVALPFSDPQVLLSDPSVDLLWFMWLLYGASVRPFAVASREPTAMGQ